MATSFPEIKKVWFADNRIWVEIEDGKQYSQPLEAFPALFLASQKDREDFYIWAQGTSLCWGKLNEDIHVSNFFENETVNYDNEVNELFTRFPWLDLKGVADYLGMHWTKLARFRYGVSTPGKAVLNSIKEGIRAMAKEMSAAVL